MGAMRAVMTAEMVIWTERDDEEKQDDGGMKGDNENTVGQRCVNKAETDNIDA